MRSISHLFPEDGLPPRIDSLVSDMPYARRHRADTSIRRAMGELRGLAVEDPLWAVQYRALADAFGSAVELLDAINDFESYRAGFSLKVRDE